MKVLELQLSELTAMKAAGRCGASQYSPEQLFLLIIEEMLAQLEDEFHRLAEYVLQKNADLYRRLS